MLRLIRVVAEGRKGCLSLGQGRFYVGAGGAQAPPNVGQAPPNILVPTAKIRILKI